MTLGCCLTVLVIVSAQALLTTGSAGGSAPLAYRLASLMAELEIETVAARDNTEPRRYVAAWHVQGAPLLTVGARTQAWRQIEDDLRSRRDAAVYFHLVRESEVEGRWLVEDHGADGLRITSRAGEPDVAYESVVNMVIFDRRSLTSSTETALVAAERQYMHMLGLLVTRLSGFDSAGTANQPSLRHCSQPPPSVPARRQRLTR